MQTNDSKGISEANLHSKQRLFIYTYTHACARTRVYINKAVSTLSRTAISVLILFNLHNAVKFQQHQA